MQQPQKNDFIGLGYSAEDFRRAGIAIRKISQSLSELADTMRSNMARIYLPARQKERASE